MLFILLFSVPVIFFNEFYRVAVIYFPDESFINTVKNQWDMVIINIVFFISFFIPLMYRRKVKWSEYGIVAAFFISLFIEMYGIPLSLLFISNFYSDVQSKVPDAIFSYEFLGRTLGVDIGMLYGSVLMIIGMIIIVVGWITLYKNIKNSGLVKSGIYSFSRHPQYIGFILIILGWCFGWPTLITLVLAPILIYKYIRVCITEEKEVAREFPGYEEYKKNVPFFI